MVKLLKIVFKFCLYVGDLIKWNILDHVCAELLSITLSVILRVSFCVIVASVRRIQVLHMQPIYFLHQPNWNGLKVNIMYEYIK